MRGRRRWDGRDMEDRTVSDDGESSHLEDDNDTEEVDAGDKAESGEDGDPLGLAEPQLGGAPEDCDHNADLKLFSDKNFHYIMMSCKDEPLGKLSDVIKLGFLGWRRDTS